MIPFLDLKSINDRHADAIAAAMDRVRRSGWYILGAEVAAFEEGYAAYCGAKHCVGVANGLDALMLSLRAVGVGAGDEVIVPSHTFVATWLAVSHVGATPVPVEPVPDTCNIDVDRVAEAVTPRTRAIVPVHLYGQPAELDPLLSLAAERGLCVVEDAAQAHGARYRGRRIGAHGDAVCWSFYPGKNLGALGDGGAVTTDDGVLADRLRALRNYGSTVKYRHDIVGFNSRLDELQAAVLGAKLPSLDDDNRRRGEIAKAYLEGLAGTSLQLPETAPGCDPVWHLFVVRHPRRDDLARELAALGVSTLIHYPKAPHRQAAYAHLPLNPAGLPVAERLQHEVVSLPIGPTQCDDATRSVIAAVRTALGRLAD